MCPPTSEPADEMTMPSEVEQLDSGALPEHVDVLIVGAGISGIGCAWHLQSVHPQRSYAILEARESIGGTWDLFRYPGIRSDSDPHTFAYEFKPWSEAGAIADGPAILDYIRQTAIENRICSHIHTAHKVVSAAWSSAQARWSVQAIRTASGEPVTLSASWLFCASGYYSYEQGYAPAFEGLERFGGELVHPQHWPEALDHTGKRVIVIGSGATAVTLVPALAEHAAHVTMLQRSPSYIVSVPAKDTIANVLRRVLPARRAYSLARRKNVWLQRSIYALSRRLPRLVRWLVRAGVKRALPEGYPVDVHFNPRYDPWDQRLCIVPDGDLFEAIAAGRATVVTDTIATFTERGVRLVSGGELEAEVIVTATGLNLLAFGGIQLSVDARPVELAQTLAFRGMMLSDVPNFAFAIGYTNASWTLKVDLVCEHLMRLLAYMDSCGHDTCMAHNDDPTITMRPLLELSAGYVQRAIHELPRQGSRHPWAMAGSYGEDVQNLREGALEDPALRFTHGAGAGAGAASHVVVA